MSRFCPYCSADNDNDAEFCKACKQRIPEVIDFDEPVKQLAQITTKIMKKEIPHTKESLDGMYRKIMGSVQLIMDRTMLQVKDNLSDLKKIQEQTRGQFEDEDFESFQRFMANFETAQSQINAGLHLARDSFFTASSFEELGKGQVDLSTATAMIQDGLSKLESLTFESQDPELMTLTPIDIPAEVRNAVDLIDQSLTDINQFTETGTKDLLIATADKLKKARIQILNLIEHYVEPGEETEEDFDDTVEEDIPEEFRQHHEKLFDDDEEAADDMEEYEYDTDEEIHDEAGEEEADYDDAGEHEAGPSENSGYTPRYKRRFK
ncbi:MAG: zinc ribbon domain-containing protein [Firmicutes bacterium]|nr:zinc ribbon domain-containing protein [Bacillota bacterium]